MDDLLTAAGQVFAAKGFHGTSMEDIARAADYATGALYRYFPGKEALFIGLLERRMDEVMAYVKAAADRAENSTEALRQAIFSQVEFASRDTSLIQIYFTEGMETIRDESFRRRIEGLRSDFERWLAGKIADGQRDCSFRPGPPPMYALMIQGMIAALFRQWASGALPSSGWSSQADFIVQCGLRALRSDSDSHSPP